MDGERITLRHREIRKEPNAKENMLWSLIKTWKSNSTKKRSSTYSKMMSAVACAFNQSSEPLFETCQWMSLAFIIISSCFRCTLDRYKERPKAFLKKVGQILKLNKQKNKNKNKVHRLDKHNMYKNKIFKVRLTFAWTN